MMKCIVCQKHVIHRAVDTNCSDLVYEYSIHDFECPNFELIEAYTYGCHYYRTSMVKGHTEYWIRLLPFRICWIEELQLAEVWLLPNNDWQHRQKIEDLPTKKDDLPNLINRFKNLKVFS